MKRLYTILPITVFLMLVLFPLTAQGQFTAEEKEVLETLNTSEETEKLIHAQIAYQWALNNPQAALDCAVQQKRNREDSIRAIARVWSENDPKAAAAALEKANVKP